MIIYVLCSTDRKQKREELMENVSFSQSLYEINQLLVFDAISTSLWRSELCFKKFVYFLITWT